MSKLLVSIVSLAFLALTACGGSHIYIEEDLVYEGNGYFGADVAGQSYSASHVELGIRSGAFYDVTPGSFQLYFDPSANFVTGNKNCNRFEAESLWYDFSVSFRLTLAENQFCPLDLIGFPENVFLSGLFEIEIYFELGRQIVVLYSEDQDVAIYLH